MKRSEVNRLIIEAKAFFERQQFKLPAWANWGLSDWRGKRESCGEIIDNMLGWDITDFGSGRFNQRGLVLFTIRNGNLRHPDSRKVYAEKIMIVREGQETPFHFHWKKMEDVINRGGGNLVMEIYGSTPAEEYSSEPFAVRIDGIQRQLKAGARIVLGPGESICLEPGVYHRFYGEPGSGLVLVGEVSQVNDDARDNRFYERVGRFPAIEADEPPLHLLASDYAMYL